MREDVVTVLMNVVYLWLSANWTSYIIFVFSFIYRNLTGPSIYSDVFPVRYADTSLSEAACTNWLSKQREPAMNVTGHCPCTLSQAEGDTAQYIQDPLCTINSDWPMNCKYRSKSASQCIISNQRRYTIESFCLKQMLH